MAEMSVKSFGGGDAVKLNLVAGGREIRRTGKAKSNSLRKIARFKPLQLKTFSKKIGTFVKKSQEATKAKNIQKTQMKKLIETRAKSSAESRTGAKINIST